MKPDDCQRTIDELNKELDTLLYAISHDLRAPLRAIDGFSQAVIEDYGDSLDDLGRNYLERVRTGGKKVNAYIDGLLYMSRESRGEITLEDVNLSSVVRDINGLLAANYDGHKPELIVAKAVIAPMDRTMARTVIGKLLDNCWKFTGPVENPTIEFGSMDVDGKLACFVRDNGVGFDMNYAKDRLFGAFQRMHGEDEFEGLGTGLATVRRIINRHGGEMWAESEPGKGTTIYFRLAEQ